MLLLVNLDLKRQSHKMVKHAQTVRRQQPTNCLSVFDHFLDWRLKGSEINPSKPICGNQLSI